MGQSGPFGPSGSTLGHWSTPVRFASISGLRACRERERERDCKLSHWLSDCQTARLADWLTSDSRNKRQRKLRSRKKPKSEEAQNCQNGKICLGTLRKISRTPAYRKQLRFSSPDETRCKMNSPLLPRMKRDMSATRCDSFEPMNIGVK